MKTLVVRPGCANKSAPISAEAPSSLLLLDPPSPEFEPPDPSSLPLEDPHPFPAPSERHLPTMFWTASRRALYAHRGRLQGCSYETIILVALDRTCLELGHTRIAQGGISPARVPLPLMIAKAQNMEAAGIILMQNRPGPVDDETPIDPNSTLEIAYVLDLLGMPLVEHIYINSHGWPFFMRERGILKAVPELIVTMRTRKDEIAKQELLRGICAPNHYELNKAARAAAPPAVEITSRRPR